MDRKPGTQLVLLLIVVVATWGCRPQPDLGTAEQIFEPEWSRLNKSLIEYSLALIPRQPTEHPAEKWVSYLYAADALVENGEMERGRRIAEGLWPDLKPSDLPNSGAPIALAALLMERMGDHELGLDWAHHIQQPGNLARYLSQTKNPLDKTDLYDKLEASLNPEKGPELPLRILVVEAALQGGRTETVRRVADDGERLYRDKTPPAYPFHDLMNLARMEAKAERHDRALSLIHISEPTRPY